MHTLESQLPEELRVRFQRRFCECFKPPFRGEIWENSAGVAMGRGYSNEGKAFEIDSAAYLKPVMREIRARPFGKFVVRAAVQMLKTYGTIESPSAYLIAHDPGDMTIYLTGDDSAFDQAKARLMPYIKSVPAVKALIEEAERNNRFDITTAEFYLPGMILRVWPLNETTTQRITLRYVLISDAFLSGRSGMIDQAIARTTQHNTKSIKDYKIIIESQGGEDGDDFDRQWKETDQRMIHVVCPFCGTGQPFEWHRYRPDDFVAVPTKGVPSLDHAAWIAHHTPILLKRRDAGMKRGPDELIKRSDGSYNENEILRQTYYECYHCGSSWNDTPAIRRGLDHSSYYVPTNSGALMENVGFSWPAWAGQRLPWGGECNMLGYLRAKRSKEEYNNEEPIKQWWQKRGARSWNPDLIKTLRVQTQERYDIKSDWPEEWRGHRCLIVDCQQELQYFWASVFAVSKTGKSRQLWRGILRGFGDPNPKKDWKEQAETIAGKQREFGIVDQFVFLDGGYMRNELVEECAKHGHWAMIDGERTWLCWTILMGSGLKDFSHKENGDARVRHTYSDPFYEYPELKIEGKYRVSVEIFYFSALAMGDMFVRYRDGKGPETLFLPETEDPKVKTSWTAQIYAVAKVFKPNKRTGQMTEVWEPPNQTTPHHFFDVGRMFMTVLCFWGIAGEEVKIVNAEGGTGNAEIADSQ